MYGINDDVEVPTTELYIPRVLSRTSCIEHEAEHGEYCYTWQAADAEGGPWYGGICNHRAKRAGLNAPIRYSSLVPSASRGRSARE